MSSLATAAAANSNPPGNRYDDELQVPETPSESPNSKGSNQMDTKDGEELGKHLDELVNSEAANDTQDNGAISFGPGHSFFRPPLYSRALVAQDLQMPDLPCIFWASIRIPLPPSPSNATDAMFDALDEFLTKMQEADHKFTVFPYNLSQYRSLTSLPSALDNPELLLTEVDDWLVDFPQAKPRFQGGDVYMSALIGTSMPLG